MVTTSQHCEHLQRGRSPALSCVLFIQRLKLAIALVLNTHLATKRLKEGPRMRIVKHMISMTSRYNMVYPLHPIPVIYGYLWDPCTSIVANPVFDVLV